MSPIRHRRGLPWSSFVIGFGIAVLAEGGVEKPVKPFVGGILSPFEMNYLALHRRERIPPCRVGSIAPRDGRFR